MPLAQCPSTYIYDTSCEQNKMAPGPALEENRPWRLGEIGERGRELPTEHPDEADVHVVVNRALVERLLVETRKLDADPRLLLRAEEEPAADGHLKRIRAVADAAERTVGRQAGIPDATEDVGLDGVLGVEVEHRVDHVGVQPDIHTRVGCGGVRDLAFELEQLREVVAASDANGRSAVVGIADGLVRIHARVANPGADLSGSLTDLRARRKREDERTEQTERNCFLHCMILPSSWGVTRTGQKVGAGAERS